MARYFFLGAGLFYVALGSSLGRSGVLMVWLGLSLFILGVSYVLGTSRPMGKRRDGSFHPLALLVHAPFLAAAWLAWQLRRRRSKEAVFDEVAPNIFVGRMAPFADLPPGTRLVVDLTCELWPPRAVRRAAYRCLPTLDGTAPERGAFWALVDELALIDGPIFIHCAAGHGRSATLAAALIMQRGHAADATAAEALMKSRRPRVGLSRDQRALLLTRT